MPTYHFKNKDTGEEFEDFMSISSKEKFLEENQNIEQVLTSLNLVDPVGIGITKPPSDFSKYVLGRIKETAPGPALKTLDYPEGTLVIRNQRIKRNTTKKRPSSKRGRSFFTFIGDNMSRKNKKSFNWNEVDETGTRLTKKPAPQFNLRTISPLTINQDLTFKAYENGSNLMLHGVAGTGKTFISMYLALRDILSGNSPYEKIVVIRSVVPVRDLGHMPGKLDQKIGLYEEPYKEICDDLFSNGQGYNILKAKKLVEFTSTSYLRGITYNNCIIVVDEVQNMTEMEIHTVMTRVGKDSKIIICGDYNQKDYMKESSGINNLFKITKKMKSFVFINFDTTDIVRSGFVKEYLLAKLELETAGEL